MRAVISSVFVTVWIAGCGTEGAGASGALDPSTQDALDEESVLAFLNGPDASEFTLVQEVRLQTRTAANIFAHVRGADRTLGTSDDDLLNDIEELDAIPYVGAASIEALKVYVRAHYQTVDIVVEGVSMTSTQGREMVQLANTGSTDLLDDTIDLDTRAVNAIVAARPLADIRALAAVPYVGATALTRLRDWVIAHPSVTPPSGDVRIVTLSASQGYGMDPYWEEHNDGVFMTWASENATSCTAELLSAQGVVYATRGPDRDLNTSDSEYFFGELGNHGGEDIDVRMTCKNDAGDTASATVRAGSGPGIVSAIVSIASGQDEVTGADGDGVSASWQSESAVRCSVEVRSIAGDSLALREGLATSGTTFVQLWHHGDGEEVDVFIVCHDANGAPGEHSERAAPTATPGVNCAALSGGTFDGVAFSAAEECTAVSFLNHARFSEMGAMPDSGRRIAYDCAPNGACGFRSSSWTALWQFSGYAGVGSTSLSGLKAASAGWTQNGLAWDTVANVWANRVALRDQPVNLDSVYVVRRLADQGTTTMYACAEVRDAPGASNFITACLAWGHDSSPIINAGEHIDDIVGTQVSLRGTLRQSSSSTGGYRITMSPQGAGAANPAVQ